MASKHLAPRHAAPKETKQSPSSTAPRRPPRQIELNQTRKSVWHNLLSHKRVVLFAVASVLFVAVLQNMLWGDLLRLDYYAYQIFVVRMRRAWLTPIMRSISELALPVVLAVLLLAVHAFAPGRSPGLCAAFNLIGVVLVNQVCKFIVQRPRPEGFRLIAESGYSFPSGHSMVAMAFYGLLAWMAWRYERDPIVKWVSVIGFALIVALVGISRIYLGVHYASDVIAGFCLAAAWLALYTTIFAPLFLPEKKTHLGSDQTSMMGALDAK